MNHFKGNPLVSRNRMYDDKAYLYDIIYNRNSKYEDEVAFIQQTFKPIPGSKILDLCGGTGTHAVLLQQSGYQVTIIDASEAMLKIAREKHPGLSTYLADIRDFHSVNTFDIVLCMYGAIHYLETLVDVYDVARNAFLSLRAGGAVLFELRDTRNLPEDNGLEFYNGYYIRKFYKKQSGISHSDIYVVTAFNHTEHFLEVHNLFNCIPDFFVTIFKDVGFEHIELLYNYRNPTHYDANSTDDAVILIGRKNHE